MFQILKNVFYRSSKTSARNSATMPKSSTSPASSAQVSIMVGSFPEGSTAAGHSIEPILSRPILDEVVASHQPDSAQATQTTFPLPEGYLGPPHPRFGANTMVVYPPISNIAVPKTPIFGTPASADSSQRPGHMPEDNDIEMKDTPELKEPVRSSEGSLIPDEEEREPEEKQATVEEENEEAFEKRGSSTQSSVPDREKFTPKWPQNCPRKADAASQYVWPDYASQVVWELFTEDEPMPKGYMGTMGGIRWCRSSVEDYSPCGSGGGHYLICGHEVISREPCGANCKKPQYNVPAFDCSQCRDIANDILNNKVTDQEHAKLTFFRDQGHPLSISLCVEYISKYLPERPGGITETVMCILNPDYGRDCLAYITLSDKKSPETLAEMFRQSHESLEQKTREHLARQGIEPLVTHDKRKDAGVDGSKTEGKKQADIPSLDFPEPSSSPCEASKKRKIKLETHREPITSDTRGTKRNTPEAESDDSGYDADTPTIVSGPKNNKKPKHKLRTQHEPITPNTHGVKRKPSFDSVPAQEMKRMTTSSPPKFGEASFMTPPASVLRPLLRNCETPLDVESSKRRRGEDVLPGYGTKDPMSAFVKKRSSLAEVVVGEDEEL